MKVKCRASRGAPSTHGGEVSIRRCKGWNARVPMRRPSFRGWFSVRPQRLFFSLYPMRGKTRSILRKLQLLRREVVIATRIDLSLAGIWRHCAQGSNDVLHSGAKRRKLARCRFRGTVATRCDSGARHWTVRRASIGSLVHGDVIDIHRGIRCGSAGRLARGAIRISLPVRREEYALSLLPES